MRFKLSKWQTVALFLPFFIATILTMRINTFGKSALLIANILMVFDIALVHAYQVYLANNFNQHKGEPSTLYKINLFIPLIGLVLYFLDVLRGSIMCPDTLQFGPMHALNFNWYMDTLYVILIYAGINYFFFNNYFVAKQIKSIPDSERKEELTRIYLTQMRQLVRISMWALSIGLAISMLADIFILFKK